jgi:hypothetical protein
MTLTPDVTAAPPQLRLGLTVSSDVSDWDSLRCWAGSGGVAGLLLSAFGGGLGLALQLGSLVGISEYIRLTAGREVTDAALGSEFHEVSHTSTSKSYEGKVALPKVGGAVLEALVGSDGLVVRGQLSLIPAGTHSASFQPGGPALAAAWHGDFDCQKNRYRQNYVFSPLLVTDKVEALGQADTFEPVTVFGTSAIVPPTPWRWKYSAAPVWEQYVEVVADGAASAEQVANVSARAYLHTSAGLRRYLLGPVPAVPPIPDAVTLGAMAVNCRSFTRWFTPLEKLHWQEDRPTFDYGIDPLRQWQFTVSELPEGATIALYTPQTAGTDEPAVVSLRGSRPGQAVIEALTDADTELVLDHNLREAPAGARMSQRWLLPMRNVELPQQPLSMNRGDNSLEILTNDYHVLVSTDDWSILTTRRDDKPGSPSPPQVLSVTLPDARVVAVRETSLVVAVPFGR